VREALAAGRAIERILIAHGAGGVRLQEVIDAARAAGVAVRVESKQGIDRAAQGANHQGIVALVADRKYARLEDLDLSPLVVVLDGVEDPHNLGAILRTAEGVGAGAVVIPERRAVGLTETVAKASAGAVEYVQVARVTNVNRALEELKERGYWIYGLDERGAQSHTGVSYTFPTVIVLGGEGKGLHEHTRKHCDHLVRIPMHGRIASLNVSVAAGVVLYEWRRQRDLAASSDSGAGGEVE
jgi:23S rRNA (guanosine2251-2'-O)-methyltransferase